MSENKCCGNSSSSYEKDMDSFCVREFLHKFEVCNEDSDHHTRIINGWTEITPDNMDEVDCIPRDKVIVGWICNEEFRSCSLSTFWFTLKSIAEQGGFYYFVLPELSISDE